MAPEPRYTDCVPINSRSYIVYGAALVTCVVVAWPNTAQSDRDDHADAHRVARLVDEACDESWETANVKPMEAAGWRAVVRRLSLALTGTVPSLEEQRALEALAEGERIDAHLDHLLRDRRFGDFFAERLARTYVGTLSEPFLTFRRRRFVYWLSDALEEGMPYDELVRRLIATEGVWTDRPAVNFITAHEQDPVRLTARSARAFLGVRLDCAQCHDHPFAHWKQSDFEGLAAFYGGIESGIAGIEDSDGEFRPSGRMMMMDAKPPAVAPKVPFAESQLPSEGRRRERLAAWVTSIDNPMFGKAIANRIWTLMFATSLAKGGVDDIESEPAIDGVLDILDEDFRGHGHDLRRLIRVIAHTRAFQLASGGERAQEVQFASFPVTKLRAEQLAASLVQLSSLKTLDADSHILQRLASYANSNDFITRYGDAGQDELDQRGGTIPQRLVMMNNSIVQQRIQAGPLTSAGRIAMLARDDDQRVEIAFLITLTRKPSDDEQAHFSGKLRDAGEKGRNQAMEDMMWSLVNTTEFTWNH